MKINPPKKPFLNYKWRWAVYTPTESLNDPPVYLGILRVLNENEYNSFSSKNVNIGLARIQDELNTSVNLVRSRERNIFRNSGQYWRALGLIEDTKRGLINLTNFGKKLANGEISKTEFATTIIKTLELPNTNIENDITEWINSNLKIKPLEMILNILSNLSKDYNQHEAYITTEELIKIIIPLAGVKADINLISEAIIEFRNNSLDLSNWPNCAESSNDKRMAREFLLFLSNYGFCDVIPGSDNLTDKYYLSSISINEINELIEIDLHDNKDLVDIEELIRITQIPANVERKKIIREVIDRPLQPFFRKIVLQAYHSTCLITGVKFETVLEAAHIKPVKYKGSDEIYNGICLRSDIHSLFDSNHLRINLDGAIILSEIARRRENYQNLPTKIELPNFIKTEFLDWRLKYY
ncbi:MAG: HNH endonuclease [Ignavibacteriales bacterium]|nr:HNH endonuclease [Ignavibacteriales bacterium]